VRPAPGAWATAGTTTGAIDDFTNYALNMEQGEFGGGGVDYTASLTNSLTSGYEEPSGGGSSSFTIKFDPIPNFVVANGPAVTNSGNLLSFPVSKQSNSASISQSVVATKIDGGDSWQLMEEMSVWLTTHRVESGDEHAQTT